MSDRTIAEVLAEHQSTSKLLSPSDVRVACLCGRFAQDDELPTYHNSWIIAHQAAALSAAGFGLVADAGAKALEDAADELTNPDQRTWLRARAAAVRSTDAHD